MTIPQSFKLQYQFAPIVLVGGIAQQYSDNGEISILQITEGSDSVVYENDDDYFAHFRLMPGGTLIDWTPQEYPYASMVMAANAMVKNALRFSMAMRCPVRTNANNYAALQQKLTYLQSRLDQHISQGGTFNVLTPGFIYLDCLHSKLIDVTPASATVGQTEFQWEFVQPLVTQGAAQQVFNNQYAKMQNGFPINGPLSNSGPANVIGSPASNQPASPSNSSALGTLGNS